MSNVFYSSNNILHANNRILVSYGIDSDAALLIANAPLTSYIERQATGICFSKLKEYDIWDDLIALYLFVGGTEAAHKLNAKNPLDTDEAYRLTFSGGFTHSATGCLPDGSTGYANTHINMANVAALSNNNTHIGFFSRTESAGDRTSIGAYDSPSDTNLVIKDSSNDYYGLLNCSSFTNVWIPAVSSSKGFFMVNRASTDVIEHWKDGILRKTGANTAEAKTNRDLTLFAKNSGTIGGFDNKECIGATIGLGLSQYKAQKLSEILIEFNTILGRL